jgi:hypothetical protein
MKKIIFGLILSLIFLFPLQAAASQPFLPELIRVGLVREFSGVNRITIDNNYLSVGYNVNGVFSPLQTVQSANGFTASVESDGRFNL